MLTAITETKHASRRREGTPTPDFADIQRRLAILEARQPAEPPASAATREPSPPPVPTRTVNIRWAWPGWKAYVERAVIDVQARSWIYADVDRACSEASRRRAVGNGGSRHSLIAINTVLAGVALRLQRSIREPIYPRELAEIDRLISKLDALADVYAVAAHAVAAMLSDARDAFAGAATDTANFGDPGPYLSAAAEELGLPGAVAVPARSSLEITKIASRMGGLHAQYRRLARDEGSKPLLKLDEAQRIDSELLCAGQEIIKLYALSGASRAMLADARDALGLEPPARCPVSSAAPAEALADG